MRLSAGVDQDRVVDAPAREVVVHRGPGPRGCADVRHLPWTTTPPVPVTPAAIPVDLAELLTPRA